MVTSSEDGARPWAAHPPSETAIASATIDDVLGLIPFATILINTSDVITHANALALALTDRRDDVVIGKDVRAFVEEHFGVRSGATLAEALSRAREDSDAHCSFSDDGRSEHAGEQCAATPFRVHVRRHQRGGVDGFSITLRDVSAAAIFDGLVHDDVIVTSRVADFIPTPLVALDARGIVLVANSAAASLIGIAPDDARGRSIHELAPRKGEDSVVDRVLDAVLSARDADPLNGRVLSYGEGERRRDVLWRFRPVVDERGVAKRLLASGSDVTAEVRARLHLDAREEILRALVRGSEVLSRDPANADVLREILAPLGRVTAASRVRLIRGGRGPEKAHVIDSVVDWCAPDVTNDPFVLEGASAADFGLERLAALLCKGTALAFTMSDLPEEERAAFDGLPIQAIVLAPIVYHDVPLGCLVVEDWQAEHRFSEGEVQAIEAVAHMIGSAWAGGRAQAEQLASEARFENIVGGMDDAVVTFDIDGSVSYANARARALFGGPEGCGISVPAALGLDAHSFSVLVEELLSEHGALREITIGEGQGARTIRFSGKRLPHTPATCDKKMFAVITDLTEQRLAEAAMGRALEEKEILLREVHHRVKNNLQVVCSLLRLQARRLNDVEARAKLEIAEDRIFAMALAHQLLSESRDFSHIGLARYIGHIVNSIEGNRQEHDVKFNLDVDDVTVSLDVAVPLGLIINEAVTNAAKHAFVGRREGTITVRMRQLENEIEVLIRDDGNGTPPEAIGEGARTLGIELMRALTRQLSATLTIETKNGTHVCIKVPRV